MRTQCASWQSEKFDDEDKDPNVLPKINKSDMAGMMEAIEENLRSCCGAIKAPLAYVIRKTIIAQTYRDYPLYATLGDKMITRMWNLPADKNMIYNKQSVQ